MATEWYYASGNERLGPCSIEELRALAAAGSLRRGELVWNESMSDWQPAGRIATLFVDSQAARGPRKPRPTVSDFDDDSSDEPPTRTSPIADRDLEPSRAAGWLMSFLDLKFRRHYTLLLVHFLWAAYLVLAALVLILCLMAVFFPNTVIGLLADLTTTFYDRSEPSSGTGSRFSGRLGAFVGLILLLAFFGMNLRVFLENLSVQFHVVEVLREMRQSQVVSRDDYPAN
jgi:hypothetical protein